MPITEKAVYIAAALTSLVAWLPAILAQRQGQSRRLSYLVFIILYLSIESIVGWGYSLDGPGHSPGIWTFTHGTLGHTTFPIGYGLPICLLVLAWDTITYLRKQSSEKKFQARIAQEFAEQAREKSRKDYW